MQDESGPAAFTLQGRVGVAQASLPLHTEVDPPVGDLRAIDTELIHLLPGRPLDADLEDWLVAAGGLFPA